MPEINVQAQWLLNETDVPMHVNQTLIQLGNGSAYLALGHLNPPLVELAGGASELTQEMVSGRIFPVVPVARVQMSLDTLVELRGKIDEILAAAEVH